MEACELSADSQKRQSPLDEVFTQPDVSRTSFLWQIRVDSEEDGGAESWELEEDEWRCLKKLAAFQSLLQDQEAVLKYRQDTFGENDIKSKNAAANLESLQSGEGAESIIIMNKGAGKEVSSDVYNRSVSKSKGVLKVAVSNKVDAYKLNVQDMVLETINPEPGAKKKVSFLRIVSVTGLSADIQQIRIHLNALSLSSSHLLDGLQASKGEKDGTEQADEADETTGVCDFLNLFTGGCGVSAYWGPVPLRFHFLNSFPDSICWNLLIGGSGRSAYRAPLGSHPMNGSACLNSLSGGAGDGEGQELTLLATEGFVEGPPAEEDLAANVHLDLVGTAEDPEDCFVGSGDLKLAEEAEPADGIDESDADVVREIAIKLFQGGSCSWCSSPISDI